PHLAVNGAVLLAVLAIGVLVYFIHHISDSVQVWTLARQVRTDLLATVDRLYPQRIGEDTTEVEGAEGGRDILDRLEVDGVPASSNKIGYVQGIDHGDLLALTSDRNLVVSLQIRPGSYSMEGAMLATVWPADRVDDDVLARIRKAVRIGQARTPHEDVEFAVLLLEEMAVRALSPGTNDPYTAINALDDLSAGLARLAGRDSPSIYRYDEQGELRVVAPGRNLMDLVDHLVDAMRRYAIGHPTVLHRTLALLEQVGAVSTQPDALARMDAHAQRLAEAFSISSAQEYDAEKLNRHAAQVQGSLADRLSTQLSRS
ncbi:MAG: DUF2254 domain-containing protein, partial [Actinomycetota bacterium]|nr:DUF2254 domain-containing protein [Actinomycetota bacterium]